MSSSRLPSKVLLPLAGIPVLNHVVSRVTACKTIDKVVVATSIDPSDDAIERYCVESNFDFYRGSLLDVLDRYYQCSKSVNANTIVRITADCPVIDPVVVDAVVTGFLAGGYDYYGLSGEFPDGLDCEVISFKALEKAWKNASLPSEREHVCPYIHTSHKSEFKTGGLELFTGLQHMRWTLDEPNDYELLKIIYDSLYKAQEIFLTNNILLEFQKNPKWININQTISRNSGYQKSLVQDKVFLKSNH
ncbi:spore coat protein [Polynucleobacter paneuropaeus]|nr:spore coat protein [Polynucleobacter paneuropaeus]